MQKMEKECLLLMLLLTMLAVTLLTPTVERASSWSSSLGAKSSSNIGIAAIELGSNNITEHLINQAYHAPRPGVPWIKLNPNTGSSCPIVSVTAYVKYYNITGPDVMVLCMWVGITPNGHAHEFGTAAVLVAAGDPPIAVGPRNVSNVMPTAGDYDLWVYCFVLDPYAFNVNVTKDFYAGWFNATVFCDLNGDDVVDSQDFELVKNAVGSTPGSAKWRWSADVDCSGAVTMVDYQLVKTRVLVHDVNVTSVTTSKTVVGQGSNVNVSVTVENEGPLDETFNVTTYANATIINQTQITLPGLSSTNFTFTWNTSGFAHAYNITTYATPVSGETDLIDNTFVYGIVIVTCLGDLNGDYIVDGQDYQLVKNALPSTPGDPKWNPNADLNDDGVVDGQDFQKVKRNIGQSLP